MLRPATGRAYIKLLMTADDFRKLALSLPEAIESSHMGHADFRCGGKVFASLGYPDAAHGMVKLTPEQQAAVMKKAPKTFAPCAGVWGVRGATHVLLASAKVAALRPLLKAAWQNLDSPPPKRG